jgi:hypothetical protein
LRNDQANLVKLEQDDQNEEETCGAWDRDVWRERALHY